MVASLAESGRREMRPRQVRKRERKERKRRREREEERKRRRELKRDRDKLEDKTGAAEATSVNMTEQQ